MSTDVASIMLPVSRGLMDRDRELDPMAGVHPNAGGAPAAVRGMKRGDPEPDAQTAAALVDASGAECKRPRIDGSGVIGEVGQVRSGLFCPNPMPARRIWPNATVVRWSPGVRLSWNTKKSPHSCSGRPPVGPRPFTLQEIPAHVTHEHDYTCQYWRIAGMAMLGRNALERPLWPLGIHFGLKQTIEMSQFVFRFYPVFTGDFLLLLGHKNSPKSIECFLDICKPRQSHNSGCRM